MDFTQESNRLWARATLDKRCLLPTVTAVNDPCHEFAKLKKMEVKSRPGNRLIQITVSGKVVGQVTEKAYKEEGVMFAAVLLLYVVGAGFSKDVFTALKTGLLGEVAD